MRKSEIRDNHCNECPFSKGIPWEAIEEGVYPRPPMLCHESSCLEGDIGGSVDTICYGDIYYTKIAN